MCERAVRDGLSPVGWRILKTNAGSSGMALILRRDDGLESLPLPANRAPRERKAKPAKLSPAIWKQRAAAYQMHITGERATLAAELGVDEAALTVLHCGWSVDGFWTFPERAGNGDIVGISTRLAVPIKSSNGKLTSKKMIVGSSHGLFYSREIWAAGDGPILLVEGASDTAAAYSMGLAAVGRPSSTDGVDHLADLLRDQEGRLIVVVGENDERDGVSPGRNGAKITATKLSRSLGRRILWSMPPAGVKDTREYLHAAGRDAGSRFVELLLAEATTVEPPGADGQIERMPDRGPARNLDEWREEARQRKIDVIHQEGYFLDRGAVGTGKTAGMIAAIKAAGIERWLWIMPDHANCGERVQELKKIGIHAVAYPKLDADSCGKIDVVKQAQSFGLVAVAAVCPSCPLAEQCKESGYLAQKDTADQSDRRIATIARAAASDEIFRKKRIKAKAVGKKKPEVVFERLAPEIVIFDERVGDVLAEIITTRTTDLELARYFLSNVTAGSSFMTRKKHTKPEHSLFAQNLVAIIDTIRNAAENVAGGGVHRVELPKAVSVPNQWQRVFADWVGLFGSSLELPPKRQAQFASGIRLITLAAQGKLKELWVTGERKRRGTAIEIEVIAKRLAQLQNPMTVFLLDADATAGDLNARSGLDVKDITPTGYIPTVQPVRQVLQDVTNSAEVSTTANIIKDHLRYSSTKRLGVIGHKRAIEAVFGDQKSDYLTEGERRRVAMTAGYLTGPDRGSNLWTTVCDELAAIGTPRQPVIRQWLIAHGKIEAASLPDGDWREIAWEGVTTEGVTKVFTTSGYRHPEWRRASQAVHRSALMQAGGRGRAILEAGIPVTFYSSEPTGFPVDESVKALKPSIREAVDAVLCLMEADALKSANYPNKYIGAFALSPVRSQDVVQHLMSTQNIRRRAAQRKIAIAVETGRLERLEGGHLIRLALPPSCKPTADQPPPESCV